jgi:hypothetical protein
MATSAELAANRKVLRESALDKLTSRNIVNLPRVIVAPAGATADIVVALTADDSGRDLLCNCAALVGTAFSLVLLLPPVGAGNRGLHYKAILTNPSTAAAATLTIRARLASQLEGGIATAAVVLPVTGAVTNIIMAGDATLAGACVEVMGNGSAVWSVRGQSSAASITLL